MTASPEEWSVGDVIDDRYEVAGVLGRGGMGVVHRVRHRRWGVDLAVKSPRPHHFRSEADVDAFADEAETWVSLGLHPHVCGCFYVRTFAGVPRVFAEYVPGGSLADWIRDGRLYTGGHDAALARIVDIAVQTAWGLDHAHGRGLVHRDVKPANILLSGDAGGTAKITDFGLARVRPITPPDTDAGPAVSVPIPGGGGWTVSYASPEQLAREPLGRRTDVYSHAASVLAMLDGGASWVEGPRAPATLRRLVADTSREPIPPRLAALLDRCLRHDPSARPATMAEVADALTAVHTDLTGRAYPRPEPAAADLRADELNNRAVSLLDLGRLTEALDTFAAARRIDPHHPQATFNAGWVNWLGGEITDEQYIGELEAVRAHTGDGWVPRFLLAQAHLERGDLDTATALIEAVADDAPDDPDVVQVLAELRADPAAGGLVSEQPVPVRRFLRQEKVRGPYDKDFPVAFDGTWRKVLVGTFMGDLILWDLEKRAIAQILSGHDADVTRQVLAVDLSPDGRYAVSAAADDTIRFWDVVSGRELRRFSFDHLETLRIMKARMLDCTLRITADGRAALWAAAGKVELLDRVDGSRERVNDGSSGGAVVVARDERTMLFAADGAMIRVDMTTGEGHGLPLPEESVSAIAVSGDGRLAATGAHVRGTIQLWDLESGELVDVLRGHTERVETLSMTPDGRFLLSGSRDGTVRFWSSDWRWRCLRTFRVHKGPVTTVELRPDGKYGISAAQDDTVCFWELPVGRPSGRMILCRPRSHIEISALGEQVRALLDASSAATSDEAALDTLRRARALPGYERAPEVLAAWRELGRRVRRTGLRGVAQARVIRSDYANSADLSADGRVVAVGDFGPGVRFWNAATGEESGAVDTGQGRFTTVRLSRDGTRVATAGTEPTIAVWDTATGERLLMFQAHHARKLRFVADERLLLSEGVDGTVRLWDPASGESVAAFDGPESVAIAADLAGRILATGNKDGTVRLWDLRDGRATAVLSGHSGWVTSVSLGPGGLLLSAGDPTDPSIRLWDTATGALVRLFEDVTEAVRGLTFVHDGRFAISGGYTDGLHVWDVSCGRSLRVITGHAESVDTVAASADANLVLAKSGERLHLWELDWELEAGRAGETG